MLHELVVKLNHYHSWLITGSNGIY